ncbi:glycogen synthase [Thermochromatium tepidum]|uniref:Glycogen synthase n=1 Tax=Thermochromatium tepidum ATCC 43061 TaxID=316276 RepID=A0A6I6EE68_THETI|nr:glycogen synthase [Thermochromatium tepidum]QGU31687.1 glycogen synthase GlgA [Thermochromatium tepidum ATCC 43061]
MHIAMVSAECAPIAKAGGLGDFVQGLARELTRIGERVEVILPAYDVLRFDGLDRPRPLGIELQVPFAGEVIQCRVLGLSLDGYECRLIAPRSGHGFFERGRIYGEPDDAERFVFFSRALVEYVSRPESRPDVLHCNDWQTGLVPVLLAERRATLGRIPVCYSLHNVGYQGWVEAGLLAAVGLDPARLLTPERLADPSDPRRANLMKGGIAAADAVNTVSPRHAWELRHTEQGMGLQSWLQRYDYKFGGILNGIDDAVWNPLTDPLIPAHFGPETLPHKAIDRHALRGHLGLEDAADRPIVAIVSRLDRQKGVELIAHGIHSALSAGAQVVLLGHAIEPAIAERFERLKSALDPNPHAHLELGYDESLSHLIYAGADMILIPSLYEPCGLTQLIAMRYGTVPIARRVGGLADTLQDANYSAAPFEQRNGYLFDEPTGEALNSALDRAIALWRDHPSYFSQLRLNGMRGDYSWRRPAREYLALYAYAREARVRRD